VVLEGFFAGVFACRGVLLLGVCVSVDGTVWDLPMCVVLLVRFLCLVWLDSRWSLFCGVRFGSRKVGARSWADVIVVVLCIVWS